MRKKKIIVAMSGGVDSSVAAHILKKQGHELIGVFLHFWKDSDMGGGGRIENKCCSLEALMDARRVCRKIGMPLYTTNFSEEFKENVVDNFLSEYARGNTPNPCVQCNRFVKLGLLIKKARELGFDYVASGHYVSNEKHKEEFKLYRGKDENKDQSYFLYNLKAKDVNWISGIEPKLPFKCEAVIRYRHKPVACEILKNKRGVYEVKFNKDQRAITPGQSVVFYNKDEVLGGGIIR